MMSISLDYLDASYGFGLVVASVIIFGNGAIALLWVFTLIDESNILYKQRFSKWFLIIQMVLL